MQHHTNRLSYAKSDRRSQKVRNEIAQCATAPNVENACVQGAQRQA
jgi:hypothetical protein